MLSATTTIRRRRQTTTSATTDAPSFPQGQFSKNEIQKCIAMPGYHFTAARRTNIHPAAPTFTATTSIHESSTTNDRPP